MKPHALVLIALLGLAGCSVSEEAFAEACKRTARVQITDSPKWRAYVAQLKSEPQAGIDGDIGIIFRGTADYEALGERFESGRKLATNVLSEAEWHIREKSTGNLIARVKTVELLKPYFGYSETLDCIFAHPEFYQRWTGVPRTQ